MSILNVALYDSNRIVPRLQSSHYTFAIVTLYVCQRLRPCFLLSLVGWFLPQFLPVNYACKCEAKWCADSQVNPHRPFFGNECHHSVEHGCDDDIKRYRTNRIGDRVDSLPYEIAQKHSCSVSCNTSPSTSHIAVMGDSPNVDDQKSETSCQREQGTIDGFVNQLVPEREVEIDSLRPSW